MKDYEQLIAEYQTTARRMADSLHYTAPEMRDFRIREMAKILATAYLAGRKAGNEEAAFYVDDFCGNTAIGAGIRDLIK